MWGRIKPRMSPRTNVRMMMLEIIAEGEGGGGGKVHR